MRNLQTKDIFSLARILKKANVQEVMQNIYKNTEVKEENAREVGMKVIFDVIGRCIEEDCEDAIYKFLSGPLELSPKEVAEMDPEKLIDSILEIANAEQWKSFLSKASQLMK